MGTKILASKFHPYLTGKQILKENMYQHPANFDLKYIMITQYVGILRQSFSNSTDFTEF